MLRVVAEGGGRPNACRNVAVSKPPTPTPTHPDRSVCLSFYLSIYLSIYRPTYLPIHLSFCLSIGLSIYLSDELSFLSTYLSFYRSIYRSIYRPIRIYLLSIVHVSLHSRRVGWVSGRIGFVGAQEFIERMKADGLLEIMPDDDPRKQTFACMALSRSLKSSSYSRNFYRADNICLCLQRKNDDLYVVEIGMGVPVPEHPNSRPVCRYLHIKERCI